MTTPQMKMFNDLFDERIKKADTPEQMRAELYRMSYHDPVVRNCMQAANFQGMGAEDRYTIMAYHLLDAYYRVGRMAIDTSRLNTNPPSIIIKETQ